MRPAAAPMRGTKNAGNQRAVNGARTRDLRLGKPTLYQLSYYRRAAKLILSPVHTNFIVNSVLGRKIEGDKHALS
jgi:hypothetical protein